MSKSVRSLAVLGLSLTLAAASIPARAAGPHHGTNRGGGIPFVPFAHTIAPHSPNKHPFKPVANDPEFMAARQQRLNKLKADLDAIAPKSEPNKDQKGSIQKALMEVVDSSTKPAEKPVKQLADDLAGILAKRPKTTLDTTQLSQDLRVVMNSANTTTVLVYKAIKNGETVLKDSGLGASETKVIATDLKAIADAVKEQGQPGLIK